MNAIVDGLLTTYNRTGTGKLVLLLHGWGDSSRGLIGLQTALSKHYEVIAVDLPGFGGTQSPKEVWDLDNYATFCNHFLEKLRLNQPYAVIGHSNGGAIAIRAIALKAVQPEKLILVAAAGIRNTQPVRRMIIKVIAKAGKVATVWLPERRRRELRKTLYGVSGSDMLVVPELQETFKKSVRQDVQKDAAVIEIPALLIYAHNDRAVPLAYGKRYKELMKHATLTEVADAGHFIHLDQPQVVLQSIEEFLK